MREKRIKQATRSAGALYNVYTSNTMSLDTKIKLNLVRSVNLALWNYEPWSGNKMDLKLLDVFHHKTMRQKLKINVTQVKEDRLKTKSYGK